MKKTPFKETWSATRIEAEPEDWDRTPPADLLWIFQLMRLIRRFEETLLQLKDQDLVYGPVHTSVGRVSSPPGSSPKRIFLMLSPRSTMWMGPFTGSSATTICVAS